MDGLCADHAGDALSNGDGLAAQHPAVDAAHRGKAEQTVVFNIRDGHPHFVHVGVEHQLGLSAVRPLFEGEKIAERRDLHAVGIRTDFLQNDFADFLLASGDAACAAETLQKCQIRHFSPPPSHIPPAGAPYTPRPGCRSPRPAYACSAAGWTPWPWGRRCGRRRFRPRWCRFPRP